MLVVAIIFLYVYTGFHSVSLSCHNFIGHNLIFGNSFVGDYSSNCLDSVNININNNNNNNNNNDDDDDDDNYTPRWTRVNNLS